MVILTGKPLLFLCLNIIYVINVVIQAQYPQPTSYDCGDATYTPNSRYGSNLDDAMFYLPNNNSGYRFYSFSVGEGPDTANAMSLCRGDVDQATCRNCLNNSINQLRQRCPNQTEAIIYYEYCLSRYSNDTIWRDNDTYNYTVYLWNAGRDNNTTDFSWVVRPLLADLRGEAADGGLFKFATRSTRIENSSEIYALEQCTPDLSSKECYDCLQKLISEIPRYISTGGRAITPSCTIRYETYPFYYNVGSVILPSPSPSPPTFPSPGKQVDGAL